MTNDKYKRLTSLFILSAILLISFLLNALTFRTSWSQKNEKFRVDFAGYRLDETAVYLEIYYAIPRQIITHKTVPDGHWGGSKLETFILKDDSVIIAQDSLFVEDFVASLREISPGQKFAEIFQFRVPRGSFLLKSRLTDLVSEKTQVRRDSLKIKPFPAENLALSAIELASSITTQSPREQKFDKNGLR
ncbi:MAG: hypothetical protein ACT6FF_05240 [Methanosarcinaceae archaeon]